MLISSDICAGCGKDLLHAKEVGISGAYNPDGPDFYLCMPCWQKEEALFEDDTNLQPVLLEKYYATFGQKRPKLYDVLRDAWI